jgi:hypothetical protein
MMQSLPPSIKLKTFVGISVLLIAALCLMSCKHQVENLPGTGWIKEKYDPLPGSILRVQASTSTCAWHVSNDARELHITQIPYLYPHHPQPTQSVATRAGQLEGENHGEYGGNLWLTESRSEKRQNLLHVNVDTMVPNGTGALIFTGYPHNDVMQHDVYQFAVEQDGAWSLRKLYDLNGIPYLAARDGDDVLVVTHLGIARINRNLQLSMLETVQLDEQDLDSIARDEKGRIYLGLRGFVLRMTPAANGYTEEWFTQKGCLK